MLTGIQYRILKRISPRAPDCCSGSAYEGKSKLAVLMGDEFFTKIAGKVIIDFGCGEGAEAVEMTGRGAQRVIGIDIREDLLQAARQKALGTVSKILVSSYLRRRSLRTSSFTWTPLSISPTPRESRSEEHTSELQSPCNLVCRLLLDKKKQPGESSHATGQSCGSCSSRHCTPRQLPLSAWTTSGARSTHVFFFLWLRRPPRPTLFPSTALFR